MALLIGTDVGLYRADAIPFDSDDLALVLDCGKVTSVRRFEHEPRVYVSSESGAYRSSDAGETWEDLGVPDGDRYWYENESLVWSILAASDGTLYAGTNDPYLYRSHDDGSTWRELRALRRMESRGIWESPVNPHYARVRGLEHVPGRPNHLVIGIEAGGVHVSRDGGQTFTDLRDESPSDDIHQVLPLDPDVYLAATGHLDLDLEHLSLGHAVGAGGVYRTTDAGRTWTRLDQGNEYSYVRRVFTHDGRLFFCGGTEAPPAWADDEHEAALFESTDFGRTFERIPYPEEPEVIEAWTANDEHVICGCGYYNVPGMEGAEGHVMRRDPSGTYETISAVEGSVSGLELV